MYLVCHEISTCEVARGPACFFRDDDSYPWVRSKAARSDKITLYLQQILKNNAKLVLCKLKALICIFKIEKKNNTLQNHKT